MSGGPAIILYVLYAARKIHVWFNKSDMVFGMWYGQFGAKTHFSRSFNEYEKKKKKNHT